MINSKKYFTSTKWWFTNILAFYSLFVHAQLRQDDRLEIPISSDFESFQAASANKDGLILYRKLGRDFVEQLEVIHLDTAFHEKWKGILPVFSNFTYAKQSVSQNHLYLVFNDKSFSDKNLFLYEVDLATGNYTRFIVRNSIPFFPTVFEVTPYGALIGGYFNRIPFVLFFDLNSLKSKVLPGLFNETGELSQLKINSDGSFDLLISARNYQKQNTIWLKNYDQHGNLIRNVMLLPEDDKNLLFARTLQTNKNTQIIAGVYGSRNKEFSRGLFIANINDESLQQIHYYSFSELENFFNYMRANRQNRVKERIQRKKIRGRQAKFQYRFLVHELVNHKDQFVLLGEAFIPRYKHAEGSYMGLRRNDYIFDGYQYTHAVVLGIDLKGNLLWDNSFEINDVRTYTLEQFVKMDAASDEIALLYLFDNKIRTKIIRDSAVLEGKSLNPIQLKTDEKISVESNPDFNKLEYWYNDYFFAYGVQNVVNSKSARKRKKVFFINKITYN